MLLACVRSATADNIIHTERSMYRNIVIADESGERCMKFSRLYRGSRQSCQLLSNPDRLLFPYTRMMIGSLYLSPRPQRILIIGLGGGTLPSALAKLLPESDIDIVEVDPAIVRVAGTYFGFKAGPHTHVFEEDGRVFVKRAMRAGKTYDLVMLDAFEQDYIPEHLLTREFLEEVKAVLKPNGVLAANTFSSSRLYAHESATYAAVYGSFFNLKRDNRVILVKRDGLPAADVLQRNASSLAAALQPLGVESSELLPMFDTRSDWAQDTRVLTDRYSPSNLLNGS
jgi:spermidine synthase